MRTIHTYEIIDILKEMCIESNISIHEDYIACMQRCAKDEESGRAKEILDILVENNAYAIEKRVPLCQDTGMAVVFLEIGQEVKIVGGELYEAVNRGIAEGYQAGYLRASVVECPLRRVNTNTNAPAVIYTDIVAGDRIKISLMPKGFGSENTGGVKMLTPAAGEGGVLDFVLETVKKAGSNPCPPIVVGVGIGGTMDKAALLAKKALLRKPLEKNTDEYLADLEEQLLCRMNELGIGPAGLGGNTTALAVYIETYPTHIAGLPVAVCISCHAIRHQERVI